MRFITVLVLIAVLAVSSITSAAQSQSVADDLATAQAAITTAQARLATMPPTSTVVPPTVAQIPPRRRATRVATTTGGDRVIRPTRAPVSTAVPTLLPTVAPPVVSPTALPPVMTVYTSLAVIPTTYRFADGFAYTLTPQEIEAATAEAAKLDGRVVANSRGMGRVSVAIHVSTVPVTTYKEYCGSGSKCGRWIAPMDIQEALTQMGAGRYDFVHTYVPDNVMTCPCSGLAMLRYFTDAMDQGYFNSTTQVHETAHVLDFWLQSQGFDNMPTACPGWDGSSVHCVYGYPGGALNFFQGWYSGTLPEGKGIDQRGWLYRTPTGGARAEGVALDAFPWDGSEVPIVHVDPEDHA